MTGKTEKVGEKPVPVLFCPSQIPHGLAWELNEGLRGDIPPTNPWALCLQITLSLKLADNSYVPMQRLSTEGTGSGGRQLSVGTAKSAACLVRLGDVMTTVWFWKRTTLVGTRYQISRIRRRCGLLWV